MTTPPSGVCYQASLPLAWHLGEASSPNQAESWRHGNIALLRALAQMEALPGDLEKELGAATKAYERLEAKLDVMLDMLARLLAQSIELPPPQPLTLWANALEWRTASAPSAGSAIMLNLYLSPKLPQPLVLPAKVESVVQEGAEQRVRASFSDLNEELTDWLERTVFRYHRRSLQHKHP